MVFYSALSLPNSYVSTDVVPGTPHGVARLPLPPTAPVARARCLPHRGQLARAHAQGRPPQSGEYLLHEQCYASPARHQTVSGPYSF